jgi:hypothetical protein
MRCERERGEQAAEEPSPPPAPAHAVAQRTHLKIIAKLPPGMEVPRVRVMVMPTGVPAAMGAAALQGCRLVMFITPVPRGRLRMVLPQAATGGLV